MPRIIDVIHHANVGNEELVWREPQQGAGDFRMGSQVIVSEGQAAVFVRGGQALDALGPGRHTLSVANIPGLTGLLGLATNGRTPFTAELYFVNTRDMPQVGWGTNPPIVMETPQYGVGVVLLQTFGVIDINVDDPMRFVMQYGVNRPVVRLNDIKDRLQSMLVGEISDLILNSGAQSVMDANRILSALEGAMLAQVNEKFQALGLYIKAFEANPFRAKEDVSLEELRNYVSLETYERLQRLDIAQAAAENPGVGGSLAGAGVGLGVGQSLGAAMNPDVSSLQQQLAQQQMMMQQMMMNMMNNQGGQAPPPPSAPEPPAAPSASALPANPQTREEIMALLDALDARLLSGEISEGVYERLVAKWQQRLDALGG
ncbi:MAG: SPFH domain-containing protein [Chloroflexi bacterium]|nr:SPFH domain-containing protein [Chloroflexota bacterium]